MLTLAEMIHLNHRRHPKKEAFVAADGRVTHGEAAVRAWGLARALHKRGLGTGDRVGVLATNSLFNAEAYIGLAAAGAVYVGYNWRWTPSELAAGIRETGASMILVEPSLEELLEQALGLLTVEDDIPLPLVLHSDQLERMRAEDPRPYRSRVTLDDPLCILYTGGSTGTPKGVVLSHRAAAANAINEMVDARLGARPGDRGLVVVPLFHTAGLLCWLHTHYIAGATSVITAKFDEESFVEAAAKEKVTNTFMIPNMLRRLMQNGVMDEPAVRASLQAVHTGAGLLRLPDKQRFADLMPHTDLYFRYGLTEAGPMVTRLRPEDILRPEVDGSMGQEYLLTQVRVLDGEGREVPDGELGELCVRGPNLMKRYYNRPEETAAAIQNGWLHTGDVVTRQDGYFYFRDRLKEMIKTGGENVYAAEVEQAMHLHPAILEAAVVGVPDPKWDEEVRAAVVLRRDTATDEHEIRTFLRQHLAGYKIPKAMVFVQPEDLPRSAAGKLQKHVLKDQLGWNAQ